jgi:hypothetical protein
MARAAAQGKKTVRTSVLLPARSYAEIQALADANDVSAAWVIRHALLKFLVEQQGQPKLPLFGERDR